MVDGFFDGIELYPPPNDAGALLGGLVGLVVGKGFVGLRVGIGLVGFRVGLPLVGLYVGIGFGFVGLYVGLGFVGLYVGIGLVGLRVGLVGATVDGAVVSNGATGALVGESAPNSVFGFVNVALYRLVPVSDMKLKVNVVAVTLKVANPPISWANFCPVHAAEILHGEVEIPPVTPPP